VPIDVLQIVKEFYGTISVLAGVLAGFSFSSGARLATDKTEGRLISIVAGCFTVSGIALIGALVCGSIVSYATNVPIKAEAMPELPKLAQADVSKYMLLLAPTMATMLWLFITGALAFTTGVALIGWVRSRVLGAVSTIAMLFTCYLIWHTSARLVTGLQHLR
jgi:hypothetical protein